MAFKQIFGTSSNDNLTTSATENEIVFLLGGDDRVNCDFKTLDYIIDTGGQDTLITGGSFLNYSIKTHAGIKDAYLVTDNVSHKINLVKGVENFGFTEGETSLDNFLHGIAPSANKTFDKTIGLSQFANDVYNSENGVSEKFVIDIQSWNKLFTINGFNAAEDQVFIVSNIHATAEEFVNANIAGAPGAWGFVNGTLHIYTPEFSELALNAITGSVENVTIYAAESSGWLKFGEDGGAITPTVLQINLSNFINSTFTANDVSEVITIPLSQWNRGLTIKNFDSDHDKLVIDSAGQYTSAQSFINANVAGSAGTWAHDAAGSAHLFNPDFNEITLAGILNAEDKPGLIQAETQGWIQFI